MESIYKKIEEARNNAEYIALCTVISTKGSTPLKTGAKMIVWPNGKIFGSIGGGALEKKAIKDAIEILSQKSCSIISHNLLQEHGMCCGGNVEVFIETILPVNKLYIFGAGHVGRALAKVSAITGFEVFLIDERKNELDKIVDNNIFKIPYSHNEIIQSLPFNKCTYITILTYDHKIDREILANCIDKEIAYLGMIGSKRKVEVTKKLFLSSQIATEKELSLVDMPMGYDLKSNNPEEIAISILAKLIEVKNTMQQHNIQQTKKLEINKR
jgi:xanthine dehydrogenase accessory factor